jgi:hypothetical protein
MALETVLGKVEKRTVGRWTLKRLANLPVSEGVPSIVFRTVADARTRKKPASEPR